VSSPQELSSTSLSELNDEDRWAALYRLLWPLVRSWTYNAGVAIWKGQEQDVAEDLVQTSMEKIFKYIEDAQKQHVIICSLEHLSIVIAKHCFLDMRRRELRLLHFSHDDVASKEQVSQNLLVDPSQEAEEKIYEEWLLARSAKTIATFSRKLRAAILVDLANRTCFDTEPTALQQAFLAVGVHLQDYQRASSIDAAERARQSALRSLAYKRLSQANLG
jgi:DNA-directed RNA polymerase specialized sigma24 family protein